jgi:hypothetical protein
MIAECKQCQEELEAHAGIGVWLWQQACSTDSRRRLPRGSLLRLRAEPEPEARDLGGGGGWGVAAVGARGLTEPTSCGGYDCIGIQLSDVIIFCGGLGTSQRKNQPRGTNARAESEKAIGFASGI